MMGGIVGRLFREFAVTLSTAILVSMVISLTTTPMMCAYLLKDEHTKRHGRIYMASERFFDWVLSLYRRSLEWVLDNPAITLMVLLPDHRAQRCACLQNAEGLFSPAGHGSNCRRRARPAGFVLSGDEQFHSDRSAKSSKPIPRSQNAIVFTGGSGATNTGFVYIALKPLSERKVRRPDIINRLRPKLNHLPVASVFLQAAQDLRIGGRVEQCALYQYTLQSDSAKELAKWGPILLKEMKKLPGLQDVNRTSRTADAMKC